MKCLKGSLWLVPALLTLLTVVSCHRDEPGQPRPASGRIDLTQAVRVVVEAENVNPDSLQIPMVIQKDPDASGGKCLAVPAGAGKPGQGAGLGKEVFGQVSYTVALPADGKYVFWGRAFWENGCGNSFWLLVDDGRPQLFNGPTYDVWLWNKGPVFSLSVGQHTITVRNREDGVRLDQFLLTSDVGYRPVGFE